MILKGVSTNVRALITDAEGEPIATGTKVNVSVSFDSGGAPLTAEVETDSDGVATYTLPAQTSLDLLTITWAGTEFTFTTQEEIVGARICSLAAIQEDVSEGITDERLQTARDIAESILEDECGIAFRPRYRRDTLDGTGQRKLLLSRPSVIALRSVELGEEALEVGDLKVYPAGGSIWREGRWTEGAQNVSVTYEHGFTAPPAQASRACALLARHIATKRLSNMDDRSTSYSTDEATYTLITPGVRGMVTAIPEVNAFIEAWQFPQVG